MDFHELYSLAEGTNSIDIKNCQVSLTLQHDFGIPTLHVDALALSFDNFDSIQQFAEKRAVDVLELGLTGSDFKVTSFMVQTQFTVWIHNDNLKKGRVV